MNSQIIATNNFLWHYALILIHKQFPFIIIKNVTFIKKSLNICFLYKKIVQNKKFEFMSSKVSIFCLYLLTQHRHNTRLLVHSIWFCQSVCDCRTVEAFNAFLHSVCNIFSSLVYKHTDLFLRRRVRLVVQLWKARLEIRWALFHSDALCQPALNAGMRRRLHLLLATYLFYN